MSATVPSKGRCQHFGLAWDDGLGLASDRGIDGESAGKIDLSRGRDRSYPIDSNGKALLRSTFNVRLDDSDVGNFVAGFLVA
ncbi:MAG: hypothetical protein AAGF98_01400 [Cyanobacteria bacterium P01_H01_bin.153]